MAKLQIAKEMTVLALIQFAAFFLLVLNYRAVAARMILLALGTDLLLAPFTFFVIRKVAKTEKGIPAFIAYCIGSLLGTLLGILLNIG